MRGGTRRRYREQRARLLARVWCAAREAVGGHVGACGGQQMHPPPLHPLGDRGHANLTQLEVVGGGQGEAKAGARLRVARVRRASVEETKKRNKEAPEAGARVPAVQGD